MTCSSLLSRHSSWTPLELNAPADLSQRAVWRLPHQRQIYDFYLSDHTQWLIASLILANFVVSALEKQFDPLGNHHLQHDALGLAFQLLFDAFNVFFLVELVLNWYAHGFRCSFWRDGWNLFDLVVVIIGVLFLFRLDPPHVKSLRILRAFRVFRLFKRVRSLKKIIHALGRALPGMANASVIMLLVMGIYAILGVELFATLPADDEVFTGWAPPVALTEPAANRSLAASLIITRSYGDEYWGSFSRAFFTMLQVGL